MNTDQAKGTRDTFAIRRPATTYADLLALLEIMNADELASQVCAQVAFSGSYLKSPLTALTHIELRLGDEQPPSSALLHMSTTGIAVPRSGALAIFTCQVMGFALIETVEKWKYSTGGRAAPSTSDYSDRESAAMAAVRSYFTFSDWKIEVANDDTNLGYFEWALTEALINTKAEAQCA